MRVLWFTNTPSLYAEGEHSYKGGGWIESLERELRKEKDIELGIAFLSKRESKEKHGEGVKYFPLNSNQNLILKLLSRYRVNIENQNVNKSIIQLVKDFKPDVIHVFGTEGADGGHISSIGNNEKEIRSVRLHDVINNEEIVDFLKIDIEGAEIEVLKDCSNVLHKVKNIFVEFHSFYNGPQELNVLLDILSKNGFRYYVQNEQIRQHPFVNKRTTSIMDMQLNIFAYRND